MIVKKYGHSIFIEMLAIYLFMIPFDFILIAGNSIPKLIIILPVLGFALEIHNMKFNRNAYPVLIYLFVATLSLLYTIDFSKSFNRVFSVALNTAVVFLFSMREYRKEEINLLCKAVGWSGVLLVVLTLLMGDFSLYNGRMTLEFNGFKQDPNDLCGYLMFSICYFLWAFFREKKIIGLFLSLSMLFVVILTGSRGGLLAIGGAIVVLILFSINRKTIKSIFLIFVASLIVGIIAWNILPENIKERLDFEAMLNDGGSGRLTIWKNIIINYNDSDTFRQLFGYGAATIKNFTGTGNVGHNVFLESLIEMGIVGAILIYVMYTWFAVDAIKLKEKYLIAAFVGYMIMTLTLSLVNYKPIWNIILLIIIMYSQEKREREKASTMVTFGIGARK